MMVLGPTLILLFFVVAFILWIKYISMDKTSVKVIREEQLYNRNMPSKNNSIIVVDQRNPVKRQDGISEYPVEKGTENTEKIINAPQ